MKITCLDGFSATNELKLSCIKLNRSFPMKGKPRAQVRVDQNGQFTPAEI
jgi:hypothetical protein